MNRKKIYLRVRQNVATVITLDGQLQQDIAFYLTQLYDFHRLAIGLAVNEDRLLPDILEESLNVCVLCMLDNGLVSHGLNLCYMTNNLEDIFKALDEECGYQDALPSSKSDGSEKDVYAYLMMFDSYLRKSIDDWTFSPGELQALDGVRKLAGILVRCIEDLDD